MKNSISLYVFAGTTAELIKLVPVMKQLQSLKLPFKVVSSGQNNIIGSSIWSLCDRSSTPEIVFSEKPVKQSVVGLLTWFSLAFYSGVKKLRKAFKQEGATEKWILVHGDTVSTLMGALLGRMLGAKVAHVEAGLRSFNYLKPFPEEICRVFVSRLANVAFCPNDWAVSNLQKFSYPKVNTHANTLMDALRLAASSKRSFKEVYGHLPQRFFVLVLHRQENLFDEEFVKRMVGVVRQKAEKIPCVFIMHGPTKVTLEKLKLYRGLEADRNLYLIPRQEFVDFAALMDRCEFLVTDGGSNQEESFYFGKPCCVLRSETERVEGLNHNVLLSKKDFSEINKFFADPESYRKDESFLDVPPSKIIAGWFAERAGVTP